MSGIDQLKAIPLGGEQIKTVATSNDGKYIAAVLASNGGRVEIFSATGSKLAAVTLPNTASDLRICLAWSQPADGSLAALIVASSAGSLLTCTGPDFRPVHVPINHKLVNRQFLNITVAKSGTAAAVATDWEILRLERTGPRSGFEISRPVPYTHDGERDSVLSLDMHPSGSAVALASYKRRSVLIVALDSSRAELMTQLKKRPVDVSDEAAGPIPPSTDEDMETSPLPSVVNELSLQSKRLPVACAWSKYGDTLAVASSDNLLSLWSVPGGTVETVAVGDERTVTRNVCFLNDAYVAVSVNDANRVLIVNIDDGVLYDSDELVSRGAGVGSKNPSLDFAVVKDKLLIFRPDNDGTAVARWKLAT